MTCLRLAEMPDLLYGLFFISEIAERLLFLVLRKLRSLRQRFIVGLVVLELFRVIRVIVGAVLPPLIRFLALPVLLLVNIAN